MSLRYGSPAYNQRQRRAARNIAAGRVCLLQLSGEEERVAAMTGEQVVQNVGHIYGGGWQQFVADLDEDES